MRLNVCELQLCKHFSCFWKIWFSIFFTSSTFGTPEQVKWRTCAPSIVFSFSVRMRASCAKSNFNFFITKTNIRRCNFGDPWNGFEVLFRRSEAFSRTSIRKLLFLELKPSATSLFQFFTSSLWYRPPPPKSLKSFKLWILQHYDSYASANTWTLNMMKSKKILSEFLLSVLNKRPPSLRTLKSLFRLTNTELS